MALGHPPLGGPTQNFFENNYLIFNFATAFLLLIVQPNVWYTNTVYHTLWYDLTWGDLAVDFIPAIGQVSIWYQG